MREKERERERKKASSFAHFIYFDLKFEGWENLRIKYIERERGRESYIETMFLIRTASWEAFIISFFFKLFFIKK
jgi:hypothetical protein